MYIINIYANVRAGVENKQKCKGGEGRVHLHIWKILFSKKYLLKTFNFYKEFFCGGGELSLEPFL